MYISERESDKEEDNSDLVTDMQQLRRREPEHFLLKVESFSESKMEKYESNQFEVGGYKWRLILYPEGDKKRNGTKHISLYLSITDTKSLPQGWEVVANFNLFVYNYKSQEYLTWKLAGATVFNWLNMESGFAHLLPLDIFKNGYLSDDTCIFGAEVFVISNSSVAKRQTLSMIKEHNINKFTWKVDQFSAMKDECQYSVYFENGGLQWRLHLYPKGYGDGKDKSVSVFLHVADELSKLPANWKVYAEYKLKIKNQINSNHVEKEVIFLFSNSCKDWGFSNLMPLSDVNDESKGYVLNDSLIVEAEFTRFKNFT